MDEPQEIQLLYEARRRLSALGVETRFTARGDALKGELRPRSDESLTHPHNGDSIAGASFTVDAEGVLQLDDPPVLRGLRIEGWDGLESADALVTEVQTALAARAARLAAMCNTLRRLGVDPEIDGERLRATARVELEGTGVVALDGGDGGLVARTVTPAVGNRAPVSLGELPVDPASFADRSALVAFLTARAREALAGRERRPGGPRGPAPASEGAGGARFQGAAESFGVELVAGHLPPVAGEVWLMEVRVEEDDGREVRYRGVNVGGTTFGAPRVLPRAAFESAYEAARDGHRMRVRVLRVEGDSVAYQRVDARGEFVTSPKHAPLIVFLANFAPEAGAY